MAVDKEYWNIPKTSEDFLTTQGTNLTVFVDYADNSLVWGLSTSDVISLFLSAIGIVIGYFAYKAARKASDAAIDSNNLAVLESNTNKRLQYESRFFGLLKDHRDSIMSYKAAQYEFVGFGEKELIEYRDHDAISVLFRSLKFEGGSLAIGSEYGSRNLYFIFHNYCKMTNHILEHLANSENKELSNDLIKLFKVKLGPHEVAILMKSYISGIPEFENLKQLTIEYSLLEAIMPGDISEDEFEQIDKKAFGDRYELLKKYIESEF